VQNNRAKFLETVIMNYTFILQLRSRYPGTEEAIQTNEKQKIRQKKEADQTNEKRKTI